MPKVLAWQTIMPPYEAFAAGGVGMAGSAVADKGDTGRARATAIYTPASDAVGQTACR